jgi:hypothetical protein
MHSILKDIRPHIHSCSLSRITANKWPTNELRATLNLSNLSLHTQLHTHARTQPHMSTSRYSPSMSSSMETILTISNVGRTQTTSIHLKLLPSMHTSRTTSYQQTYYRYLPCFANSHQHRSESVSLPSLPNRWNRPNARQTIRPVQSGHTIPMIWSHKRTCAHNYRFLLVDIDVYRQ